MVRALLAVRVRGTTHGALPWIEFVVKDMTELQRHVLPKLDALGDPWEHAHRWFDFMKHWPAQFAQLVKLYAPTSTAADCSSREALKKKRGCEAQASNTFPCATCSACFDSAKALAQHRRIRHGERMQARQYVGADSSCPVCGVQFSSPTRVIAYVSEKRVWEKDGAVPCGETIASGRWAALPAAFLERLSLADRAERAAAWKRGWSQPHAEKFASRARDGRTRAPDHLPSKRIRCKTPCGEICWSTKRRKFCEMSNS